ncbi:MAG: potassium-transporting ATPase subunit C [Desulfobulbaceae bacterium A2]|nr:MAG: potassium-transporting ATPase subunit C [Desulfobulbaceae bacterium A2]
MFNNLRSAVTMLGAMTLMCGLAYPFLVTGLAQLFFPFQANGSIVMQDGQAVGSALIGQAVNDPALFWGRPSATTPVPCNGGASGGSNLGQGNPALHQAVTERLAALAAADPDKRTPVPVDLVTASASGLDPHISVAAARWQAGRVARARHLPPERVLALIDSRIEGRTLGILGESRVNVLQLNLALRESR